MTRQQKHDAAVQRKIDANVAKMLARAQKQVDERYTSPLQWK